MGKLSKLATGFAVSSMLVGLSTPTFASSPTVQANDDTSVNVVLQFKDLKSAEWALRYIASMQAEGVFNGFEDGTFRPSQAINRVQAIVTAVRLMGLEDQAAAKANTALNFKDADKIQRDFAWATGYIAVALEKGLLESGESTLQPEQPATRLWVSTLLVKAMGFESEALAKMNTTLTFTDKNSIPATSIGYVAVAVEKGILQGYPDNTFQPLKPVTRAEMATLLDRTNDQLPTEIKEMKKQRKIEAEGVVTSVSANSLTVKDENGKETTFDITNKILVFHSTGRGSVSDIHLGDRIEIKMKNGRAVLIEVKNQAPDQQVQTINGTVASITLVNAQQLTGSPTDRPVLPNVTDADLVYKLVLTTDLGQKTLYVTPNTKIEIDGISHPTISNVKAGDKVSVTVSGYTVITLKVTTNAAFEAKGTLVSINTSAITIKNQVNQNVSYNLAADLKIDYTGHDNVKLSDLTAGLNVTLKGQNQLVNEIHIED